MVLSLVLVLLGGFLASGILIDHKRWLAFLAVAGAWAEGVWLVTSLIDRTIATSIPTSTVFTIVGLAAIAVFLPWLKKWSLPKTDNEWLSRDGSIALVIGLALLAAWSIASVNGYQDQYWVTHGFFNGDTVTFATLVDQSRGLDGLAERNVFAAGTPLEYPTVLHGAVATFLDAIGAPTDWFGLWPWLTYGQIILTIPLFFLLFDVLTPAPKESWQRWFGIPGKRIVFWLQAAVVLFVLTLSWDGYIYPQSHFFLTNLFVFAFVVLQVALSQRGNGQIPALMIIPIAVALSVANAVTGTAVAALLCVWFVLRALDKRRTKVERTGWLLGIPLLALTYTALIPGAGSLGIVPGFSYSASSDLIRYTIPILLLGLAGIWHLKRHFFVVAGCSALFALAGLVFFFSSRDIIVANASRFLYHAVLISAPLLLYPLARVWYWAKRELMHTSHTWYESGALWLTSVTVLGLVALPSLQSVASAHDNLIRKDTQRISVGELEALQWLHDNTPTEAVILASPEAPFSVPLFAKRSVLRTSYWLSPDDETWQQVVAAFEGDGVSQGEVIPQADYLYLRAHDTPAWSFGTDPVFRSSTAEIYQL